MKMDEILIQFRNDRDKNRIVSHFEAHPHELIDLVDCIRELKPYPEKEYASWILIHLTNSRKFDIQKYYPKLVDVLFETDDQTVLRNLTKCLTLLRQTNYRESELLELLLGFLHDQSNKVALHVYSIYLLKEFVRKYPKLKSEIMDIINMNLDEKSAAFHVARRNFIAFSN